MLNDLYRSRILLDEWSNIFGDVKGYGNDISNGSLNFLMEVLTDLGLDIKQLYT